MNNLDRIEKCWDNCEYLYGMKYMDSDDFTHIVKFLQALTTIENNGANTGLQINRIEKTMQSTWGI